MHSTFKAPNQPKVYLLERSSTTLKTLWRLLAQASRSRWSRMTSTGREKVLRRKHQPRRDKWSGFQLQASREPSKDEWSVIVSSLSLQSLRPVSLPPAISLSWLISCLSSLFEGFTAHLWPELFMHPRVSIKVSSQSFLLSLKESVSSSSVNVSLVFSR